jgi:hypothetical protein
VRYVDAGYTICLAVLFLYAVGLVLRRRRLARAAALAERPGTDGSVPPRRAPDLARPEGDR